jgi:hypothetical protein
MHDVMKEREGPAQRKGEAGPQTFDQNIAALAATIARRDAEARARFKRPLPVAVSASEQRLLGWQQGFTMWCANELHSAVRQADNRLAPTGWRVQQITYPPPARRPLEESARHILAQTEIVLARGAQHVLTVTACGDGMVRILQRGPAGDAPGDLYPDVVVQALDAGYATALVLKFVTRMVAPVA